jgi:hypothetical protein
VSLTGTSGIGGTRLALEAAAGHRVSFRRAVAYVKGDGFSASGSPLDDLLAGQCEDVEPV